MHASSSKSLNDLEASLGYSFRKKSRIDEALTHKSYIHEKTVSRLLCNERMEFLGDAVLELIVSEYLYSKYPEYTEADLSKIKSFLVRESSLAEAASSLNIGTYLLLGKGEEMTGGRKKPSLLANAFEAILAAIYLDGGYKNAKKFVLEQLSNKLDSLEKSDMVFDYKTNFQEMVQSEFGVLPTYLTNKEEGPEHMKTFEVKVFINDKCYGTGKGKTKKAAAQKAAEKGLRKLIKNHETDI